MPAKHLVIIHGRDKKPEPEEMNRLVRTSLIAGLARVNEQAAQKVRQAEVKISFIYYGDINNRILIEHDPDKKDLMTQINGSWYVRPGYYDDDLERLMERPTNKHTKEEYELLTATEREIRLADDAARIFSPLLSLFGISSKAIKKLLPDLGSYLTSRVVGSEIRERLQAPLAKALLDGDEVMLLSHSMGCMIAYDVLWKLSRMSEYKSLWDKKIRVWLTLGSPLGEPSVQAGLYDSNEPDDGMYPKNIEQWTNISAKDDYIAHDSSSADDFHRMLSKKLISRIDDLPPIYTFWKDHKGRCNPHNFFAYLNHPQVAEQIVKWIADR